MYKRLGSDEVSKANRISLGEKPGKDMYIVSESGLYKLIMRSDKPEAAAFQDWVTREVLPSIRKTGAHSFFQFSRLRPNLSISKHNERRK